MNGNDRISPRRSSVLAKYTSMRTRDPGAEPGGAYDLVKPGVDPGAASSGTSYTDEDDQVRHHLCYSEHTVHQVMLSLILRNGLEHYLPYHYMEEGIFDPAGRLELFFTKRKVTIAGQNLHPVALAIRKQHVGYIKETDGRFMDGDASEQTLITRITVDVQED